MPEALVIQLIPGGGAKKLQMMEFAVLPQRGDYLTIGPFIYAVDSIVHKADFGRAVRPVIRVVAHSVSESALKQHAQAMLPQRQQQHQMPALPQGQIIEDAEYEEQPSFDEDGEVDWMP